MSLKAAKIPPGGRLRRGFLPVPLTPTTPRRTRQQSLTAWAPGPPRTDNSSNWERVLRAGDANPPFIVFWSLFRGTRPHASPGAPPAEERGSVQYDSAEWESAFLRQAREFLFFPLLPREASKRVPVFDRGTGSKPERLRSGFLQGDLSLIV